MWVCRLFDRGPALCYIESRERIKRRYYVTIGKF